MLVLYNRCSFGGIIMIQMTHKNSGQTNEYGSDKTYKVLNTIEQRYEIMDILLDSTPIEKMFVGWDKDAKEILTVKAINKNPILDEASKQTASKDRFRDVHAHAIKNEVSLLEKLSHENIPKLYDCSETGNSLYLFLQYCPKGSIHSIVTKTGPLGFEQLMPIWRQLLRVTLYLHRSGIVHRDIRPRNLYVNQKGKLKLMSFKCAYVVDQYSTMQENILEKTPFMAPEIFAGQPITPKMDVWSLGVTLFFMLYGCSPWPHVKETDWHRRLGSSIIFPEHIEVSTKFKMTIEKMLVYDPLMRVSMKELAHYFAI